LFNRILTGFWVLLGLGVLAVFLSDRADLVKSLLERLKREPQAVIGAFKPREMAGFVCDFTQPEDSGIWKTVNAAFTVVDLPMTPARWGRVNYYPSGAPGFLWDEESMGTMDWRGAVALEFEAYNPNGWAVEVKLKVKDTKGAMWQQSHRLPPGQVTALKIPLSSLASRLDPGKINYFNIFLWEPSGEVPLCFTNFRFPRAGEISRPEASLKFLNCDFPPEIKPGSAVEGVFYFLPQEELSGEYTLLIALNSARGRTALLEFAPPFPPARWRPGRTAKVGPVEIPVPVSLVPGVYDLEVILARKLLSPAGEAGLYYEPYDNPELAGHSVAKVIVRP